MHYLSIHFHPNFAREFVRAVSRELDDGPFLTRTDPDFCREGGMIEEDSYQQPETVLLCHCQGNGDRGRGLGFLSL